jgi:CheY-like chemotaxis protein
MSAANPTPTRATTRSSRVLLVEDEALIALTMVDQLVEAGYTVVGPAFTMTEALNLAVAAPIDAALVDFNLNGVFASEVVDILARRRIPFLFVTGYNHIPDERYLQIPVLAKPFDALTLQRAVEGLLAGTGSQSIAREDAVSRCSSVENHVELNAPTQQSDSPSNHSDSVP